MVFNIVLGIVSILCGLFTLLPATNIPHWSVRDLEFPRLQIAVIAFIATLAGLYALLSLDAGLWVMAASVVCAAVCIYQITWILPFTPLSHRESESLDFSKDKFDTDRELKIISSNVLKPNRSSQHLLNIVASYKPDILVTLETDDWWERQLTSLEETYQYVVRCPQDNLYGLHVYSRLRLSDAKIQYLVEDDIPSVDTHVELRNGEQVRLRVLHPCPPSPTENVNSTERDVELIIVAKDLKDHKEPTIVTGDLNDVAWSRTTRIFKKLSGFLDPRVGRGLFNTFHAKYPFLRWPLDHVFHSEHFGLVDMRRVFLRGSDHFALFTHLRLKTNADEQPASGEEALDQGEKDLVEQRFDEYQQSS